MRRKNQRLDKELQIEKRLKVEASKDYEESKAEIDQLLDENEGIKSKLRSTQYEMECLYDEYNEVVDEHNALIIEKDHQKLEMIMEEAKQVAEMKFSAEKVALFSEIETYNNKCKALRVECEKWQGQFLKCNNELQQVRCELKESESYRQDDICRLLDEKESRRADLKAKKTTLASIEKENEKLVRDLRDKEREIKSFKKYEIVEKDNEAMQVEIADLKSKMEKDSDLQSGNTSMEAEIAALKSKIEQKDSDLHSSLKGQDILKAENNNLKSILDDQNAALESALHDAELLKDQKNELQLRLNEKETYLNSAIQGNSILQMKNGEMEVEIVNLESALVENEILKGDNCDLKTNLDGKKMENAGLVKMNEELKETVEKVKTSLKEASAKEAKAKSELEDKLRDLAREKMELEESFAEERGELNEQLDAVLEANAEIGNKCIELETKLEETEEAFNDLQALVSEDTAPLATSETAEDAFREENEEHQRKIEELSLKLADAEDKIRQISEESSGKSQALKNENRDLSRQVEEASIMVAKNHDQMKKQLEEIEDLLTIIQERNHIINHRDAYIDEVTAANDRLKIEVQEMQGVIQELEENLKPSQNERQKDQNQQECQVKEGLVNEFEQGNMMTSDDKGKEKDAEDDAGKHQAIEGEQEDEEEEEIEEIIEIEEDNTMEQRLVLSIKQF